MSEFLNLKITSDAENDIAVVKGDFYDALDRGWANYCESVAAEGGR